MIICHPVQQFKSHYFATFYNDVSIDTLTELVCYMYVIVPDPNNIPQLNNFHGQFIIIIILQLQYNNVICSLIFASIN
jgi:hypothetical protein